MHPWHDVYIDEDQLESTFPVVIEVPMGSKNKYELDKESGLLRLDRVLFSAVHYRPTTASCRGASVTTATHSTHSSSVKKQSCPSRS